MDDRLDHIDGYDLDIPEVRAVAGSMGGWVGEWVSRRGILRRKAMARVHAFFGRPITCLA